MSEVAKPGDSGAGSAYLLEGRAVRVEIGRRVLIEGADVSLRPGEWKAVVGPNGAGKSTLLRALATLVECEGRILFEGRAVAEQSAAYRRALGVVLHEPLLYRSLTALENLVFYARLYGVEGAKEAAMRQLEAVDLAPFAHEPVRRFSKGMLQRLAVARALLAGPRLLLLDEPLAGIDAKGIDGLLKRFAEAKREGVAALWVTHHWHRAWPLVDEFLEMAHGRIVGRTRTAEASRDEWRPQHAGRGDEAP